MPSIEGLRLKINKFLRLKFANNRNKKLENKDFTIISNNCWGGMIYESYNLKKLSPTVGLFFMADDYIKFISNIKYYLNCELKFINKATSKNRDCLANTYRFGEYPIGLLDDIEIYFVHYKSEEEAKEKWKRRCKRINFNNILFKFSDQNGCTENDVINFSKLQYKNKLLFTVKDWNIDKNQYIKFYQYNKKNIQTSHEPFGNNRKINITTYLNNMIKDNDI